MAEKPILFNTEMVIAILDGRKTMTRRAVKPQPNGEIKANIPYEFYGSKTERIFTDTKAYLAPYSVGDVLWVRETWADNIPGCPNGITYRADHIDPKGDVPATVEVIPPEVEAELADLRKKSLNTAELQFKMQFKTLTNTFNELLQTLDEVDSDNKEKYQTAIKTLIDKMLEFL